MKHKDKIGDTIMMDKDFLQKRDEAMKRFMAAKTRKRERLAVIERSLKEEYKELTGEEALHFEVW